MGARHESAVRSPATSCRPLSSVVEPTTGANRWLSIGGHRVGAVWRVLRTAVDLPVEWNPINVLHDVVADPASCPMKWIASGLR